MNVLAANQEVSPNSHANNAPERVKSFAVPFIAGGEAHIREMEVSVTATCNLTCKGCGFHVPFQPNPVQGIGITEHIQALNHMKEKGLRIGKIVVVGGEASLVSKLSTYLLQIRETGVCNSIELVTNGLYPRGLTTEVLELIDSLVISDYVRSIEFENLWQRYLSKHSYNGLLDFRRKPEAGWDDLTREVSNSESETNDHWSTCFYRKYDITLERGRLFSCSRIAKKQRDDQGLLVNSTTTLVDIERYLNASQPKEACFSCATVGCTSKIPVAQQQNTDLQKILSKTLMFLRKETQHDC